MDNLEKWNQELLNKRREAVASISAFLKTESTRLCHDSWERELEGMSLPLLVALHLMIGSKVTELEVASAALRESSR